MDAVRDTELEIPVLLRILHVKTLKTGSSDRYISAPSFVTRRIRKTDTILKSIYRHAMSDRQKEMADRANDHFSTL